MVMDAKSLKQIQLETWTNAAPGWKRNDALLRGFTAPVTARMVAGLQPGQRVLDVASGTGEPALEAAARVGPTGNVLGFDFVAAMLELAREKAASQGLRNVEFRLSDGEALDVSPGTFDVATMRWGLMFMPDPLACLRRVHAALKPGGRLALACWASPEENPWASVPTAVLRRHLDLPVPPPDAPGLFAFADPERLRATIGHAGFQDVTVEKVAFTMAAFPTGAELIAYQLDLVGPIAAIFNKLPAEKRADVTAEMAREVEKVGGVPVKLPGATWLATARA
jgi:SAM-dependent methyltransferase